ncbi:saccharopine dehydrogenase NADP-binding domain-containing protein [Streptacidiphilus fuscans]|uniref:Saccharopine dehydrogenase NADP-binding domain-containing protein n=1 Tax=Streptacidiphilus fuscans TaxID=2789292 RepID=A0A931AYI1_9ACTN|nr:saccharopine dehydrogenase NADP-binding domain-containing protein [Streptacidiphilus fuscans]MBF9067076.1 saccharopine dehydrogenase NADP-binding domain-containing protein [Streptacidiphilus fuscans]
MSETEQTKQTSTTGSTAGGNTTNDEVWIVGASGRVGRAVTARLAARGLTVVPVGRSRERMVAAWADAGLPAATKVVVADSAERIADEIVRDRPRVVVNTMGSFAATAPVIARACMSGGGHYVDQANDVAAVQALLALHDEAVRAGSILVTGAGFGVLATEAVVAKLCEDRPAPHRVRVDAAASVAVEAGLLGAALAASIVDVLTTGGRRYEHGRLVTSRLGADPQQLAFPDGESAKTAGVSSGELVAAQAVSGAPFVIATSALVPTAAPVRALLPLLGRLLSVPALRRLAVDRLARVRAKATPRPRRHSWGHAVVEWTDGTRREGWLRAGDGMDFTADVTAAVTEQLARGTARPGAWTPAAALGAELATAAGGTFVLG